MQKTALTFILLVTALSAQITEKRGVVADISLITDFSYVYQNLTVDQRSLTEIPGFTQNASSHAHADTHSAPNTNDGFNLNYAELGISSTVDPYFDLYSIFHITQESIEIEEVFFVTKKLPVEIKAGRFYSNFGRINTQHHHYWSFTTQPLVYNAMFGMHNLLEKGLAFNYTLPSDNYYSFGIEMLRGENEQSFGAQEIHDALKGIEIEAPLQPNLYVAYVKNSFEIGDRLTVLDNLSYAYGQSNISHLTEGNITSDAFSGTTQMVNLGLTLRYDFSAYSHLSFENEFIYRNQDGTHYAWDANTSTLSLSTLNKSQSGFYSMVKFQADQNWGWGIRYDAILQNDIQESGLAQATTSLMYQTTMMVEYNPSEFSKIRLEYVNDNSLYLNNTLLNGHQVILQFNHIIGTHKAHSF